MDTSEGRDNGIVREEWRADEPLKTRFVLDNLKPPAEDPNSRVLIFANH